MWVAKISDNLGKLHDYELSPRFKSIYDCQDYINSELIELEQLLQTFFTDLLANHQFKKGKRVFGYTCGGRFIRCYNVTQQRFATGFDF